MLRYLRAGFCWLSLLCTTFPAFAIDVRQVEKELATTGAVGWIHGAVKDEGLFVFTYRNPNNFFDYLELALVARDSSVQARLVSLSRHDKVRIKGSFLPNPSPQKHVLVTSIELIEKYKSSYPADPHQYNAEVPHELLKKHEAIFLVHAVAGEGHILVLDYKGLVVPLFAADSTVGQSLSRNDIVRIKYIVRAYPHQPIHLDIDPDVKAPVEVVESIKDINGKPASIEGALVLFPKSPEIVFNVFAVLEQTESGANRQFTIVNFDNPEIFKQARDKLQQAWDKYPGEYINGRNKLISKKLRVRVTGTFNQVSASQANPQILISSVNDIEITEP